VLDSNGNTLTSVTGSNTTTYAWDFENRMTSVTLPGFGGTVTFKYDPFGRRIYKSLSSGTSVYAYDGDNLVEETNSAGGVVARYEQTQNIDEPLAMLRSSATSYFHADGLGSVTSLSNAAGSIANTYTYDSFGKLTASTGSLVNPFQYTAHESDPETGLYYYRARYYDQSTGRFISEDPLSFDTGFNFYRYGNNDPVIAVDPWGLSTLVFDRATGTLSAFDKDNNFLFSCTAGNQTPKNYPPGRWPNGTYPYGYHNPHPADPNGPFGNDGIFVFIVPGRDPGMGVHSGRANKGGPSAPTHGCVRTNDNCMDQIVDLNGKDPLKCYRSSKFAVFNTAG
jgi:RHS repeat-associated protein